MIQTPSIQTSSRRASARAVVAGSAWLLLGCAAGPYFPERDTGAGDRVGEYLTAVMDSRPIPGMAVAVVRRGEVVYSRGFGVQELGTGPPVTPETIFHTASVSKALVATAAMQLVQQGKLDLDTPVTRYVPYFRLAEDGAARITARHILTHTSGMPDVEDYGWESPEFDDGALERYVRSLADQRLRAQPGETWAYSNMAFEVLGDVIAKISGVPFEQAVQDAILGPLGMAHSSFLPGTGPPRLRAVPHRGNLAPAATQVYPYHRAHAPSSTLRSSVNDLARFVAAMLNGGRRDGITLLPEDGLEEMWRPGADVDRGLRMGLGWFLRKHRGNRMVLHPGRDPGFNAMIGFLPERGVGVAILTNYDGQSAFELVEIADGILDVGLGRRPALPKASVAVPVARVLASRDLEAAIAEYHRLREANDARYDYGLSDLITLGHELRRAGRTEEAIRLYQLNAAEHPDYFASEQALASAYLALGDKVRAVESYRKVLAMKPERYGCPPSCYRDERLEALLAPP